MTTQLTSGQTPTTGTQSLTQQIQVALQAHLFESRLTITPRRTRQLADEVALAFRRYLTGQEDSEAAKAFGQRLAQEGLGPTTIFAIIHVMQSYVTTPSHTTGEESYSVLPYYLELLAGYMAAREAHLLAEQERTRLALARAQAG